jgi:hypothetical protein
MRQMGFYDLNKRLDAISAKGDPVEVIKATVPWESFRRKIETATRLKREERKSKAGHSSYTMPRAMRSSFTRNTLARVPMTSSALFSGLVMIARCPASFTARLRHSPGFSSGFATSHATFRSGALLPRLDAAACAQLAPALDNIAAGLTRPADEKSTT